MATYSFCFGVAGLTPTITTYIKESDGTSAGSAPSVTALSVGWYKFTATPTYPILLVIDSGDSTLDKIYMRITENDVNLDALVSARASQSSLDSHETAQATSRGIISTNLNATVSSRSTLTAQNVWEYATRTLSSFGTLIADIWAYTSRTLTEFSTSLAISVWDVLESSIMMTDSIGLKVKTNLNIKTSDILSNAGFINKFGSYGNGDGQFYNPVGIHINPIIGILITDSGNHRVQLWSMDGVYINSFGSYGSGQGQFYNPTGITYDGNTDILTVADSQNNRLQQFYGVDFSFIQTIGSYGTGNGQFDNPHGISSDGVYLYVCDLANNRIQKFNITGTYVMQWGSYGTGDGQFNQPTDIYVSIPFGRVYVTDANNNRIQVFDSNGNFLFKIGSQQGTDIGQFNYPMGIVVDENGYIYVADTSNHRIQKFTSSGEFVCVFGVLGSGDLQFDAPSGMAFDPNGYLNIIDNHNHRNEIIKVGELAQAGALRNHDEAIKERLDNATYGLEMLAKEATLNSHESAQAISRGIIDINLDAQSSDILTETQSHPTLAEIEATTVLAKEAMSIIISGNTDELESRLTTSRSGYLDYLSGGMVALEDNEILRSGNLTIQIGTLATSSILDVVSGDINNLIKFVSGDYRIDTSTTPWREDIYIKGTSTKLITREYYKVDGTSVSAITDVIGIKSGV